MSSLHVRWHRVVGAYVALAVVCLGAGVCMKPPLHDILILIGVFLAAGFFPLIMAIYFLRGFLGIH